MAACRMDFLLARNYIQNSHFCHSGHCRYFLLCNLEVIGTYHTHHTQAVAVVVGNLSVG